MEKIDPSKAMEVPSDIDGLVSDAISSLRADEKVYSVISNELKLSNGEVRANLALLLDYQDDVHYCDSCPGLDRCAKATPRFCVKLEKKGGVLYRHLDPCPKQADLENFESRFLIADFPSSYRDADLKNVEKSKASREGAILKMTKVVLGKSEEWLYLTGNRGAGKTHLLVAFASSFSKRRFPVAYCDTTKLVDNLKELAIKDKEEFAKRFASLSTCPLLILDDFGNEFKSEFVFASILFPLLNERAKNKLPTAFASDFPINDIYLMYKDKVGGPRARQLASLLLDMAKKENDISGIVLH